jgi:DDE superfamily endonuclease
MPASTHRRRLNVFGFLNRHNDLYPYIIEGKVDTATIVEGFELFSQQIKQSTYVLLDNAPMHRAHDFIQHIPIGVKRG